MSQIPVPVHVIVQFFVQPMIVHVPVLEHVIEQPFPSHCILALPWPLTVAEQPPSVQSGMSQIPVPVHVIGPRASQSPHTGARG